MHVDSWLERAAATRPGRPAVVTEARTLTYSQLRDEVAAGVLALRAMGVGRDDRVGLALPAGAGFAVALHACLALGAVAVPVDRRLSARERQPVTAGCAVVLEAPPEGTAEDPRGPGVARHELSGVAVVVHTSGSTAAPRPVELTYSNWLWSALGSGVALGIDTDERWLCALPVSHVGGLSILLRSVIYATTAIIHERFETDRVLHCLMSERVTLVSLVPTTLARLLDAGLCRPPHLRRALIGGAPVPTALLARAREAGVEVSQTYGLTEACSQVTTEPAGEPGGWDAGPPLFCTRVRLTADHEIEVSGPTVAPASRGAGGWLATGDLGELTDGRLRVIGRGADTIVTGAENVAPTEVEAVLAAHPQVLDAAVYGRPDPEWGEAVVAAVVARDPASLDPEQLRSHCASQLAAFKVPKSFRLVSELPRTPSGKLRRAEL